jgi:hypothetical protein
MRRVGIIACLAVALSIPVGIGLGASDASASVVFESPYTFEQTFGTALRLIRVDLGFKVTEKDVENGFLLFEYRSPESGKKATQGSIELVNRKSGVQVAVQLPAMPQYHEQMILDALTKKLATEHGEPPKKSAPPPPADGGTDDAAGSDG